MENNIQSMTYKVVALVLIILVIVSVALPVIEDAQLEIRTETNNTTANFNTVSVSDVPNLDLTVTASASGTTIGDWTNNTTLIVLMSDNFYAQYYQGHFLVFDVANDIFNGNTTSIVIDDGVATYTVSNVEYTVELEGTVYYGANEGDSGLFTGSFNINKKTGFELTPMRIQLTAEDTSTIYLVGAAKGTVDKMEFVTASVWDSVNSEYIEVDPKTITATLNVTESDDGYYTVGNGVSYSMTYNDVVYSGTTSNAQKFAPIEYGYIAESDSQFINLIGIIPLLLIICAVMFAVRMIGSRN